MADRLNVLERRIEELSQAIAGLESRLSEIERRGTSPHAGVEESPPPAPARPEPELAVTLSLVGRTLLALGGAYLLRAFTEAGAFPPMMGAVLGLAYASLWVYMARRAAALGKATTASFHGAAAALIGYPLLWETTVRLRLFGPGTSAVLVLVLSLSLLLVAWRFRLSSLAWVTELAAIATAFALMGGARSVLPYAGVLVVLSVFGLVLDYPPEWAPLQRTSALVADAAVAVTLFGAFIRSEEASAAAAVALVLFFAHAGSFFHDTLVKGRDATIFEMVQASLATLIGYGGAVAATRAPLPSFFIGFLGVVVAIFIYVAAARRVTRPETHPTRLTLTGLGLIVMLSATAALPRTVYLWTLLAAFLFVLGIFSGNSNLRLHVSIYLLAAAVASGLFVAFTYAFFAPASVPWPSPRPESLVVLSVAGAAFTWSVLRRRPELVWHPLLASTTLLVTIAGGGALALFVLAPHVSGEPGGEVDPALLAALRTAVLGAAAIGIGALSMREPKVSWLVYAILLLGGMKLVWEDFPRGRAESLFLALACYGLALIVAPRLARSRS